MSDLSDTILSQQFNKQGRKVKNKMSKQIILKEEAVVSVTTDAVLLDDVASKVEEAIANFNEAKRLIKELEAQKAEAEALLREFMGDAEVGLIAGVERVKIATRTRNNINTEVLKTAFPEAFEQASEAKTYTVVTAVS